MMIADVGKSRILLGEGEGVREEKKKKPTGGVDHIAGGVLTGRHTVHVIGSAAGDRRAVFHLERVMMVEGGGGDIDRDRKRRGTNKGLLSGLSRQGRTGTKPQVLWTDNQTQGIV